MPLQKIVNNVYVDVTPEEEAEWAAMNEARDLDLSMVRNDRDGMLSASDWTQLPGGPLTDEQKTAWDIYRDELRDLPSTITRQSELRSVDPDTNEVTDNWPTPPE